MKYLLAFLMIGMLGCSTKPTVQTKKVEPEKLSTENMKQIEKTTKTLNLVVNEEAYYQAKVHGSVGTTVEVQIENEGVYTLAEKVSYLNPERAKMPGGDAATKTFVLKAVGAGQSKITIRHLFRGDVKSEQVIESKVSKD